MGFQERGLLFTFLLTAVVWAPPAAAGSLYAWRSEDGVYSYTDDRNAIPERYRDSVVVSESKGLEGYARFTAQVGSDRAAGYSERLRARLQVLREGRKQAVEGRDVEEPSVQPGGAVVSLGSAGPGQPRVELSAADPSTHAPLIIEPLITRRPGDSHTRRTTVIRQGDRTLVVVKGERHHRNPSDDVIDERDL